MYLIEILLPLTDNDGNPFPADDYHAIRTELTKKFGGITAFSRAPAHGEYKDGPRIVRDDVVLFEIMTDALDQAWWTFYRTKLEQHFKQDEIVIRATQVQKL